LKRSLDNATYRQIHIATRLAIASSQIYDCGLWL